MDCFIVDVQTDMFVVVGGKALSKCGWDSATRGRKVCFVLGDGRDIFASKVDVFHYYRTVVQ